MKVQIINTNCLIEGGEKKEMKKINRLLFTITIVLTAFIGLRNVNADTILNPDATCGDFPKDGDALITNCSSSGEESDLFDVTITNWYKGDLYSSSTTAPGEPVGTTGVYESGYKYYLELKFKPKDGNEFDAETPYFYSTSNGENEAAKILQG